MSDTVNVDAGRAQRLGALERADEVRSYRAALKKQIAAGETTVAHVLADRRDWRIEGWTIGDVLLAQRQFGRARRDRFLRSVVVSPNVRITSEKPIGRLNDVEVGVILQWLGRPR